jgi:hypothetical protein
MQREDRNNDKRNKWGNGNKNSEEAESENKDEAEKKVTEKGR